MNIQRGHVRLDLAPTVIHQGVVSRYSVTRAGLPVGNAWTDDGATWCLSLTAHRPLFWVAARVEDVTTEAAYWLADRERAEGFRRAAARGDLA